MIKLSKQAIKDLKEVLKNIMGSAFEKLDEDDFQYLGNLFLHTMATSLKIRARMGGIGKNNPVQ